MTRISDHAVRALEAVAARMTKGIPDHPTARALQSEVNRLASGAAALDNARASRTPLDTPEAHALKVGKMSKAFDRSITGTIDRASAAFRAGLQDAQRRIDQKINLTPDAFAQEIRAAFRNMDGKAKANLINQLVEENRGPELAAIVKAPAILTGISEEQRAVYEKMIISRHAGDELDEIAHIEEVFSAVLTATDTAANLSKRFSDPVELAKIERADSAAKAASDAFEQSLAVPE
jgi:hypothetical protein